MKNESAMILDIDPFNPLAEATLEYQLTTIDEGAIDSFMNYIRSFKVRFDSAGNVIITRREYDQLDKHFRQSLRLIKAYEKAGDVDSVKHELAKIEYMIQLIDKHYMTPMCTTSSNMKKDIRKEMMDLRSVMMNVFQQHLNYVMVRDPKFNFADYYKTTEYSDSQFEIPHKVVSNVGKALLTKLN
jgi:hypothetical protein